MRDRPPGLRLRLTRQTLLAEFLLPFGNGLLTIIFQDVSHTASRLTEGVLRRYARGGAGSGGPCGRRLTTSHSGRLRAPNPAGTTTRKRDGSEVEELRCCGPGWHPGTRGRPEPRTNAAVERREARALRNWARDASKGVSWRADHGTQSVRRSAPAPLGASPPSCARETEKKARPDAPQGRERPIGRAER